MGSAYIISISSFYMISAWFPQLFMMIWSVPLKDFYYSASCSMRTWWSSTLLRTFEWRGSSNRPTRQPAQMSTPKKLTGQPVGQHSIQWLIGRLLFNSSLQWPIWRPPLQSSLQRLTGWWWRVFSSFWLQGQCCQPACWFRQSHSHPSSFKDNFVAPPGGFEDYVIAPHPGFTDNVITQSMFMPEPVFMPEPMPMPMPDYMPKLIPEPTPEPDPMPEAMLEPASMPKPSHESLHEWWSPLEFHACPCTHSSAHALVHANACAQCPYPDQNLHICAIVPP